MYKLKDKKIAIWRSTTEKVNGVNVKSWKKIVDGKIWAHYRQTGGSGTYADTNGVVGFSDKELATFVINNRGDVIPKGGDLIVYNHKIYTILVVDDFTGNAPELKINTELAEDQNFSKYNGLIDE